MTQKEKIELMRQYYACCLQTIDADLLPRPTTFDEAVGQINVFYQNLKALSLNRSNRSDFIAEQFLSLAINAAAANVLHHTPYTSRLRDDVAVLFDNSLALAEAKGHDYAGDQDACSNLRDFGWQGIVVRLSDKKHRLNNFVKQGVLKVKDEAITDTLIDITVYCILACVIMATTEDSHE